MYIFAVYLHLCRSVAIIDGHLGFEKSQRSVTHDSLRYINILTYLLTYLHCPFRSLPFCNLDLDLEPMTLIYELYLKIVKMYMHAKK